eukprot:6189782-Pleurochrysis_carterae.AAC.1
MAVVREARCVGLDARFTSGVAKARGAGMESTVHVNGGVVGGHDLDVVSSPRGMDVEASAAADR